MGISEPPGTDSIAARIAWAEACFRVQGDRLHGDGEVAALLGRLLTAARRSHEAMSHAGVVAECTRCEHEEGGSCCGAGLEDRYDGVTLLINLLLRTELPHNRADPRSCLFLGPAGCTLAARDVICINYLCRKIADKLGRSEVELMHDREGQEIEILFRLHARITTVLRGTGDA